MEQRSNQSRPQPDQKQPSRQAGQGSLSVPDRHPEQAMPHPESAADTPLAPLLREQQGGDKQGISHEQLVGNIRHFIQREQQVRKARRDEASPKEIIRNELVSLQSVKANPRGEEMASPVWFPLRNAWDALTYDRYQPGSFDEVFAGWCLSEHFQRTHEAIIRLSNLQVRILDALTDAVGIPHQKGRTEIEIPKKLRNYDNWQASEEYQERLGKVQLEWERWVKAQAAKRNQ
jgi:hypothetical protein